MRTKYTYQRNNDTKMIQTRISNTQFLAMSWLVEKGKAKTVSNLVYLAVHEYINTILTENTTLADNLTKYIEKISKAEPFFKIKGKPFEIIPQKVTATAKKASST